MNNPKTIEDKVLFILKECPQTRNDDMELYLFVCDLCFQKYGNTPISELPFAVVMKCYKELGLPHFESVRRARAKIQASNQELAASPDCKKGRKQLEGLYARYSRE